MSVENLPARLEQTLAGQALTSADTDSWAHMLVDVANLAERVASTDFVPAAFRDSPAAVTAAILYGREVHLPPMTALQQIYVHRGRPGMYAEGMRALVLAAGHELQVVESTGSSCTIRGRRRGSEQWTPVTWTLDVARQAGLWPAPADSAWKKYPRSLLQARASVELCRLVFPDVIHGLVAMEEITDAPAPGTSAEEPEPSTTRKVARKRISRAPQTAGVADSPPDLPPLPEPAPEEPESPAPPLEQPPLPLDHPPEPAAPEPEVDAEVLEPRPQLASRLKVRAIVATFHDCGVDDREERLAITAILVGHPVSTTNELTSGEASNILDTLALCNSREDLQAVVDATRAHQEATDAD